MLHQPTWRRGQLPFQIADYCVPQDHWQLKGKAWDVAPQTAVTTSPGPRNQYGVPARVYNYGGTANNPRTLDTLIECSYVPPRREPLWGMFICCFPE